MTDTLNIIELFASVQGETSFTGLPTTFIRLAACNLRCSWCDTAYSFGRGTPQSLDQIYEFIMENGHQHVCVTGGEPLLQANVYPLMTRCCDQNLVVSLETGGSLSISEVDPRVHIILDIKCPGSLMDHKNEWSNLPKLRLQDEVKFVIKDRADYDYAKKVCDDYQLYQKVSEVLFAPVFDQLESRQLVEWILQDRLRVRLNLQTHKYIWAPLTRGV